MPKIDVERLKAELSVYAGHVGDEEIRNETFISQLCQAVETKLRRYYRSGESPEARLQRLAEISQMFNSTEFSVGDSHTISIKADGAGIYSCPAGTECVGGNCVPVLGSLADVLPESSQTNVV